MQWQIILPKHLKKILKMASIRSICCSLIESGIMIELSKYFKKKLKNPELVGQVSFIESIRKNLLNTKNLINNA